MARRSDHSQTELRALLLKAGHEQMAQRGFGAFSARESARKAGYAVGTIYNTFGSLDNYILAINTQTFCEWTDWLHDALAKVAPGSDRISALVSAYFDFAEQNLHCWMAIYDHRRPQAMTLNQADVEERAKLTGIIDTEVARLFGCEISQETRRLTRSLIATVHGHCALHLGGSFALMDELDPLGQATARVKEILSAHSIKDS